MELLRMRFAYFAPLVLTYLAFSTIALRAQAELPIMPLPSHAVQGSGSLIIDNGFRFVIEGPADKRLKAAQERFLEQLGRETGILRFPAPSPDQPSFTIQTTARGERIQQLGEDESYHLTIAPEKVILSAPNALGVLHGLQTFLQLVHLSRQSFVVDSVTIEDNPRFAWRGLMIDSSRHFIPVATIRQNLDLMETVKLNVFHWHLSDDQGFRVESKVYPLLQGKGSDGFYYTQDEIRSVIAYARDRGIRVIPEFDMPAHAASWFIGYPSLASGKGPYSTQPNLGVPDAAMDPTRESTYTFLDRFIGEMTALFPDAYFHIGGDECNGKQWDVNPRIQTYMKAHHLKDNAALQAYFTGRVQRLVTRHHKITIGWDEVLQPDTPRDVIIQSWRGQDSLAVAARQGNRGILSWGYYLDLNESAAQHYAVDPLDKAAAALTQEQQKRILGGEAAEWTEYITSENLSERVWPRAAAIAERLWSPQNIRDDASMYRRLALISRQFAWHGLPTNPLDEAPFQRLIGNSNPSSLKVLANIVEPTKEYVREDFQKYDGLRPLNHLVDVVPAESDEARQFRQLAGAIASGGATSTEFEQARHSLEVWRDNDATLQPILAQSALVAELGSLSRHLRDSATIGLVALDAIEKKIPENKTDKQQQLVELKTLEAPDAVLLNMIVPGVESLVHAAPSR